MSRQRQDQAPSTSLDGTAVPAAPGGTDPARRRRRRLALLAVVVFALVSMGVGSFGILRTSQGSGVKAGPNTILAAVDGGGAEGQARVTGDERRRVITLETLGLGPAGPGRVYQVWLGRQGQDPDLPVGVLATDNQGLWSVPAAVATAYDGQVMEVRLEEVGGDPGPDGQVILRGPFRDIQADQS